jgi:hypothetical protein
MSCEFCLDHEPLLRLNIDDESIRDRASSTDCVDLGLREKDDAGPKQVLRLVFDYLFYLSFIAKWSAKILL